MCGAIAAYSNVPAPDLVVADWQDLVVHQVDCPDLDKVAGPDKGWRYLLVMGLLLAWDLAQNPGVDWRHWLSRVLTCQTGSSGRAVSVVSWWAPWCGFGGTGSQGYKHDRQAAVAEHSHGGHMIAAQANRGCGSVSYSIVDTSVPGKHVSGWGPPCEAQEAILLLGLWALPGSNPGGGDGICDKEPGDVTEDEQKQRHRMRR